MFHTYTIARVCTPTKTRKGYHRASRPCSPAINEACKHSTRKFLEWKCDGRPPNANSLTFCNLFVTKPSVEHQLSLIIIAWHQIVSIVASYAGLQEHCVRQENYTTCISETKYTVLVN